MSSAVGQRTATGVPARILDVLETDGGWLTTEGITLLLGANIRTVRTSLYRLKARGEIEHRTVELGASVGKSGSTYSGNGRSGFFDLRAEWRTL